MEVVNKMEELENDNLEMENNPLEEIVENVCNELTIEQDNLNEDKLDEMFDIDTISEIEYEAESGEENGN